MNKRVVIFLAALILAMLLASFYLFKSAAGNVSELNIGQVDELIGVSSDGKVLTQSKDSVVALDPAATGKIIPIANNITRASLSNDGNSMALLEGSGDNQKVVIRVLKSGEENIYAGYCGYYWIGNNLFLVKEDGDTYSSYMSDGTVIAKQLPASAVTPVGDNLFVNNQSVSPDDSGFLYDIYNPNSNKSLRKLVVQSEQPPWASPDYMYFTDSNNKLNVVSPDGSNVVYDITGISSANITATPGDVQYYFVEKKDPKDSSAVAKVEIYKLNLQTKKTELVSAVAINKLKKDSTDDPTFHQIILGNGSVYLLSDEDVWGIKI